ncbi:hypothetical protein HZB04_00790 [Candidatus Wolfebacteria bacterium]|nr:hypothetical protein [Candidatus Wolfebacteria bacterium]
MVSSDKSYSGNSGNSNQKPLPQGHCDYCGETVAARAPSRNINGMLFHNGTASYRCYSDYMAIQTAKDEIPVIFSLMEKAGFSKKGLDSNITYISFRETRDFICRIIKEVRQLFSEIRNKAVQLIQELHIRLDRLTCLFKLPEVDFPAPAYPTYDV